MKTTAFDEDFGLTIEANGDTIKNITRDDVVSNLQKHGMVHFSGYGASGEDFHEFTNDYSDDFMSYKGGRYERRAINTSGDSTIVSVNYYLKDAKKQDTWSIPMHGEMYYQGKRPVMIWFYCETPARVGGATTVCDGQRMLNSLQKDTLGLFESKKLKYVRYYPEEEWKIRFQTDDIKEVERFSVESGMSVELDEAEKTVTTEYLHPAIISSKWGNHTVFVNNILTVATQEIVTGKTDNLIRLEDDSKIPMDILMEIKGTAESLTRNIPWQAGDFAVLDNTRVMHGREEFEGNERQIYSRMVHSIDW